MGGSASRSPSLRGVTPTTTGEAQRLFMRLLPRLIDYIHSKGYECTAGDAYRDPRVFGEVGERLGYGHPKSNHKRRMAFDVNLFKDGAYLSKTEDHKPFGEWWQKQHPLCRWGGEFEDGNHYSLEWDGIK